VVPKVIIADANKLRGETTANVIKGVGFEPVVVQTGQQIFDRLHEAGDIDVVLIDHEIFEPLLEDLLAQLRADVDWSAIPLLITVPPTPTRIRQPESSLKLQRLANSYRNVTVIPATLDPDVLKPLLPQKVAEAMGQPYTEAERKQQVAASVNWLRKLAVGEVPGYDVRPAENALAQSMRSADVDLARTAVLAGGRVATRSMQRELAAVVLSDQVQAPVRATAAAELNRSIQQMGNVLLRQQLNGLGTLYKTAEDPALKSNLALVFGSVRPDAGQTGARLKRYEAAVPAVAPAPQEKKEEEKKEEKKEEEKKEEK
jgi:vacuolar-type H+-ATPase subunit F/Vma7